MSRLRGLLTGVDGVRITRGPGGYLVVADPLTVDLHLFRHLVSRARTAERPAEAAALFAQALDLWRGDPFPTVDVPWFADLRTALQAERLAATLDRNDVFPENSFDVVLSCVGAMFAPRHQTVADELIRVTRPGGTIGMINWTPQGFIGNLFATMGPYAPPPPPGATPPPRWGDEEHVRALFGDRVTGLDMRRQSVRMDHHTDPTEFREYWKRNYGPTIAVYKFNADRPERVADLDRDFLKFLTAWSDGTGWEAEYLLVTAQKV